MATTNRQTNATVTRFRIPEHVAFRDFVVETVMLNLKTGKYHGLNRTAGRMLTVLSEVGEVPVAAQRLADEYGVPAGEIEADLQAFVDDLVARDLLAVDEPGD
jgi:Coenzyme PQQ synthesis protein D (PqqD)